MADDQPACEQVLRIPLGPKGKYLRLQCELDAAHVLSPEPAYAEM